MNSNIVHNMFYNCNILKEYKLNKKCSKNSVIL